VARLGIPRGRSYGHIEAISGDQQCRRSVFVNFIEIADDFGLTAPRQGEIVVHNGPFSLNTAKAFEAVAVWPGIVGGFRCGWQTQEVAVSDVLCTRLRTVCRGGASSTRKVSDISFAGF